MTDQVVSLSTQISTSRLRRPQKQPSQRCPRLGSWARAGTPAKKTQTTTSATTAELPELSQSPAYVHSRSFFWNRCGWLITMALWMMTMHLQQNTFFKWGPNDALYVFGIQLSDVRHYVFVLLMIVVDRLSDLRPTAGPENTSSKWAGPMDALEEQVAVVYGQVNLLWRVNTVFAQIDLFVVMVACDMLALGLRQVRASRIYRFSVVSLVVGASGIVMYVYWLVAFVDLDMQDASGSSAATAVLHPAPF